MTETSRNVITVRGLTKSYGATSVLKGVDFSVARGEVHALLGGNGAPNVRSVDPALSCT